MSDRHPIALYAHGCYDIHEQRICTKGTSQIRNPDPDPPKETDPMARVDSSVPLMRHDLDRSRITDPDPDHPKGTHPMS